jgi:hypothetical protein
MGLKRPRPAGRGTFGPGAGASEPVVPGTYLTAISVSNPNDARIEFRYAVAFTLGNVSFSRAEERLDVWAVYTAAELGDGDQISIDAEQVLGRRLEGRTAGRLVD